VWGERHTCSFEANLKTILELKLRAHSWCHAPDKTPNRTGSHTGTADSACFLLLVTALGLCRFDRASSTRFPVSPFALSFSAPFPTSPFFATRGQGGKDYGTRTEGPSCDYHWWQ